MPEGSVWGTRARPATDKKVLTSWNALMISGYVDAYRAFGRDEYLNTALKAANFLDEKLTRSDGGLSVNAMKTSPPITSIETGNSP